MPKYVVVPIVEGYGEVQAVPVLIRRWLEFRRYRNVDVHIDGPVRASGRGAITVPARPGRGVEHYVRIASGRKPDVILVLLDADDDCPKKLGSELLARARSVLPAGFPVGVVVANREYEAWFLAASRSPIFRRALVARGLGRLPDFDDPEAIADCKKRVGELMLGDPYQETIHQRHLTEILPFTRTVTDRSRSFRKLLKELDVLLRAARRRGGV